MEKQVVKLPMQYDHMNVLKNKNYEVLGNKERLKPRVISG